MAQAKAKEINNKLSVIIRMDKTAEYNRSRRYWTSSNPGLIVILLDISELMSRQLDGTSTPLSARASKVVNQIIESLILHNFNGEKPVNRCFIEIIGYSENIQNLKSGFLSDFDENPLRIEIRRKTISDGAGGLVEIDRQYPVWLNPIIGCGVFNISNGFNAALNTLKQYQSNKQKPAPIIVNISSVDSINEISGLSTVKNNIVKLIDDITRLRFLRKEPPYIINLLLGNVADATESTVTLLEQVSSKLPCKFTYRYGLDLSNNRSCIFTEDDGYLYSLINWLVIE